MNQVKTEVPSTPYSSSLSSSSDSVGSSPRATPPSEILECDFNTEFPLVGPCPRQTEIPGEFYFESDHEALRGNPDYLALLKTLSILQAQKAQAVSDLEALMEAKTEALADPLDLVNRLQRGEIWPKIPGKQAVATLPPIHWEKYRIEPSMIKKPETRHGFSSNSAPNSAVSNNQKIHLEGLGCKVEKTSDGHVLVRGRLFDDRKPKTFNQPWTPEEQKRLEELLVEFPSEDVEMERWKKIANALGNRTAIQVQSRIQKYFLKLQKAGLPIPGRITRPKIRFYKQNRNSHYHQHHQRRSATTTPIGSARNSSFFPNVNPSVKMSEDDEYMPDQESIIDEDEMDEGGDVEDVSDEENVSESMKNTEAYRELIWLKRIRREKEIEQREGTISHLGFRCDGCAQDPILGTRWHCCECPEVDFCNDCAPKELSIGSNHDKSHQLRPIRKRRRYVDQDYTMAIKNNYLDPNFMQ